MRTAPSTQAPVSVIIPVFNGENHLHELIESIQAQSHRTPEIILTQGGCGDSN
jgi:glycosyltransferase involved in cell wall biosynthesis